MASALRSASRPAAICATTIIYPKTCTWDGALTFAQLNTDKDLTLRLIGRFDPLLAPEGSKRIPRSRNVDNSVFGAVPLGIYMQTKDTRYLQLGRMIADRQWENAHPTGLDAGDQLLDR